MTFEEVIIQKLATKYNLPLQTVENIVYSQFRTVAKEMKKGDFASIMLPYFGKFYVKPKRLELLRQNAAKSTKNKIVNTSNSSNEEPFRN